MATHRRPHHLAHPRHRRRHRQGTAAGALLEAVLRRLPAGARVARPRTKPDVVVVFYNDHGLNFFLDKMPTFAVGARRNTAMPTRAGASRPCRRSRAIRNSRGTDQSLVERNSTSSRARRCWSITPSPLPIKLFWPDGNWPREHRSGLHQHGAVPAAERQALRTSSARRSAKPSTSWKSDKKVVILGTGGCQPPAGRRARGLHQQAVRPQVHAPAWWTTRNGRPSTASSNSSRRLERRASSS